MWNVSQPSLRANNFRILHKLILLRREAALELLVKSAVDHIQLLFSGQFYEVHRIA